MRKKLSANKSTRKYSGKVFRFNSWVSLKSKALDFKKWAQARGAKVRIEKLKYGYNIWTR